METAGKCPKCNSEKVMKVNAESSEGSLWVSVARLPGRVFFKGIVRSKVNAWVCGSCGFTEFYSENPDKLWEAYQ